MPIWRALRTVATGVARTIGHSIGGVKAAHMPGCVAPDLVGNKSSNSGQLLIGIIKSRNDQGGYFKPDTQSFVEPDRFENLSQNRTPDNLPVK